VGRTLVLGASGFLGPHVVAALAGPVIGVSREPGRAPVAGRPGRALAVDLSRPDEPDGLIDRHAPHAVVNCVALARVDACEGDPDRARAVNVELPARTARACAARGIRLVHVSTDLVFDGELAEGRRHAESDPPSARGVYGRSKAEGEHAVLAAFPHALVVRLPLLFGDSGGRGLGASDGLVAAIRAGRRPALFTDEWRTPLDAAVAGAALAELCARAEFGVLHVAGPERLSRHELGRLVLRAHGFDDACVEPATRAERRLASRPRDVSLDASAARALLATRLAGPSESLGAPLS
jgi:dTDP-4-dehydrorhamnose reductase